MTFVIGNNPYNEEYDEFGNVYGCTGPDNEFIRCKDCCYAECPMREKHDNEEE